MRPRLPVPPALLREPFRLADALALGVSAKTLRGPQFRRVVPTVYVAADIPDSIQLRYDAARLVLPPMSVASHELAAGLWGLPVPRPGAMHITVSTAADRRRPGVIAHVRPVGADVRIHQGRPVLSPERTFCDLAAARPPLGLVDLVILGDAAVRAGSRRPSGWSSAARR